MKIHLTSEQSEIIEQFTAPHIRASEWEEAGLGDKDSFVLFYGPAGTGKTTIAQQIAHRVSGIPLNILKTSLTLDFSEILSNQLGVSEKLASDFFKQVYALQKKHNAVAPVAIFDEVEAIMYDRALVGQGNTYQLSIITHILKLCDTFRTKGGVLLATTNFPEKLDRAFFSRFNYSIVMPALTPAASLPFWMLLMPEAPFGIPESQLVKYLLTLPKDQPVTPREIDHAIKNEIKRAFAKRETMQITNLLK